MGIAFFFGIYCSVRIKRAVAPVKLELSCEEEAFGSSQKKNNLYGRGGGLSFVCYKRERGNCARGPKMPSGERFHDETPRSLSGDNEVGPSGTRS